MIEVVATGIDGLALIRTHRFHDDRGHFSETWSEAEWQRSGLPSLQFVQENVSRSRRNVLRGLHYQLPPFVQTKLVRVTSGRILDVVVDCRRSSPTFGQWTALELSAADGEQLLVGPGLAHGFLALEDGSEVQYKVTAPYHPSSERAIRADDPSLRISWPTEPAAWIRSDKDASAAMFADSEMFD